MGFGIFIGSGVVLVIGLLIAGFSWCVFVYGQYIDERTENGTWIEDQSGLPNKYTLKVIDDFCISDDMNHYKDKDKIVGELVDNGTVSTFYTDWTCHKVEKTLKSMEDLGESFSDVFTLGDIQNKIKHNNETLDDIVKLQVLKDKYKDK